MEDVRVIELTDEEIWLRIYCAAMSCALDGINPTNCADIGLQQFKQKFSKEE